MKILGITHSCDPNNSTCRTKNIKTLSNSIPQQVSEQIQVSLVQTDSFIFTFAAEFENIFKIVLRSMWPVPLPAKSQVNVFFFLQK